ncbi:diguanylate cyclase domain-containing protein [Leptothoe kymatousa]|uniref:Diguanylate cyclase n=1 Tax=Leptothoe kymatousa TAU-MAC 1615 TaxID=2364775 RepID=A0ABS5Y154_9CYAN|nr:diguanylate cyclase [Leptothoe kymatousa]MBT9311562.1 diguanylate cyclase [Leptothoe kymatousa TAU-MAC 1615]
MSIASEQFSQSTVAPVFLDSPLSHGVLAQTLLDLNQCEAIGNGDLDIATNHISQCVVESLEATSCHIWLYSRDRTTLKQVATWGNSSDQSPNELTVDHHPDYFQTLSQQQCLVLNSCPPGQQGVISKTKSSFHPSQLPPYLSTDAPHITALLEVPIYRQNQVTGILCCTQHHSPRVWQPPEKSFLISAACMVGLTLSQFKYQQQTQVLNRQKRQLSLANIEQQQAEKAWQESQRFIQGILDASSNILYVNDFASGTNYYVNGFMQHILGYSPQEIQKLGPKFLEQIANPKDIQAIHQARTTLAQASRDKTVETEYRLRHKQGSWHWMLCRETIFQWHEDGTPLQLLGTATDITVHKENTKALEQKNQVLTELAMVDGLTQIANRRAFDDFLDRAWADRTQSPLSLILCDIDFFKPYNDNYGHQQGDKCIQKVARAITDAVKRRPDLVARYGGEEFAIVLPNTTQEGAKNVAQNIQIAISNLRIEHHHSGISEYVSLSLGIATAAAREERSPNKLIAAADQGLYHAKSNGRNQFSVGYLADEDEESVSIQTPCQLTLGLEEEEPSP